MARHDYLPAADAALLAYTGNFQRQISATPAGLGVSPATVTAYTAQQAAYAAALQAATDEGTRGKRTVFLKNEAKAILVKATRAIAQQIGKTMSVTDAQRQELGLTIPTDHREKSPVPAMAPVVTHSGINGRTVRIKLGRAEAKRGRPAKVTGATIFTAPAGAALNDADAWSFNTSTTKTMIDVTFPAGEAETVQITAFWTNALNESGPAANPLIVNLPASQQLPSASSMRLKAA